MKYIFIATMGAMLALSACDSGTNGSSNSAAETNADAKPKNAEEFVAALKASGLPVSDITTITAENDSNKLLGRPNQYISKANFYDTRHPVNADEVEDPVHTIEVFANSEDAKARHDYIEEVTKGVGVLAQYQILEGKILLRMDKAMLPNEVEQYRAAMGKIAF